MIVDVSKSSTSNGVGGHATIPTTFSKSDSKTDYNSSPQNQKKRSLANLPSQRPSLIVKTPCSVTCYLRTGKAHLRCDCLRKPGGSTLLANKSHDSASPKSLNLSDDWIGDDINDIRLKLIRPQIGESYSYDGL